MRDLIEELEAERYAAMLRNDAERLAALLHAELVYTHSSGDRDSKQSYLDKVKSGFFKYHEIAHTIDRIVHGNDCAVVAGTMRASVTIGDSMRSINNSCLAVWLRSQGEWQLAAYQPTPLKQS